MAKNRGLSRHFNRRLKNIYKSAAMTVISQPNHPLCRHYHRLLDGGLKPPNARLTLARKIAAASLAMWKNQEIYDTKRHEVTT